MPMDPAKKAALEKYLKNASASGEPPMKEKMGDKEMPAEPMDTPEEGMEEEDTYGDYEGPESYRSGQEDDGELEVYSADRDPEEGMKRVAADEPLPEGRQEDAKARGKRIGSGSRPALRDAFTSARGSLRGA